MRGDKAVRFRLGRDNRELMPAPVTPLARREDSTGAVLLGGAGGAAIGAALDSKNPARGAFLGGLLGALVVALASE